MLAQTLESAETMVAGTPIAVRPVRPQDEPALQDLFSHMIQEDRRLRFLVPMHALGHPLAARLSQFDYSREMALVAEGEA